LARPQPSPQAIPCSTQHAAVGEHACCVHLSSASLPDHCVYPSSASLPDSYPRHVYLSTSLSISTSHGERQTESEDKKRTGLASSQASAGRVRACSRDRDS
ncbi:unnamed protein product, partial [Ectocarpus sp. 8 AP-2014]